METKQDKKAIQLLKELYLVNNKIKYPNFPDHARPLPKYTDKTANGLTQCIIHFINYSGGQAERINCTGRIIDNRVTVKDVLGNQRIIGSIQYAKTAGQRGTSDISATIKGRSVKIEVKIGNDRQSEAQRQYQQSIEKSGGLYFIATDFEMFFQWYQITFGDYGKRG